MKKLSVFIVMSFFAAFLIMAQPPQGFKNKMDKKEFTPEQKATKMSEKMKTDLGLSDEQTKQVYNQILAKDKERDAIKAKYQPTLDKKDAELKAVHEKYKTQLEPMQKEMKASMEKGKDDLKNILTKEQLEKWESMKPKFDGTNGPKGKKGCMPPHAPQQEEKN